MEKPSAVDPIAWLWLSAWLSQPRNSAGMDGNRTHPGRLSSAPQTVLNTAFLTPANVQRRSPRMKSHRLRSADVRKRLPMSDRMAVSLAVRTSASLRRVVSLRIEILITM